MMRLANEMNELSKRCENTIINKNKKNTAFINRENFLGGCLNHSGFRIFNLKYIKVYQIPQRNNKGNLIQNLNLNLLFSSQLN